MTTHHQPWRRFACRVYKSGTLVADTREVVSEEPLTIAVGNRPLTTLMQTPGNERELALGYLLTEGLIHSVADVGVINFCSSGEEGRQVQIQLIPGASLRREPGTIRQVFSSCAVCGAEAVEELARDIPPFSGLSCPSADIQEAGRRLRSEQVLFERTGGTHAAALCPRTPLETAWTVIVREDIGRHNALDKVVGAAAIQRLALHRPLLFLSGRLSFEMVAKAARAGIGVVAGVSAPTALSVELARRLGMVLVGFARGDTFTLYAGPELQEA